MINYFSQVIRSQRVKKSLVLVNIIGLSVCIATSSIVLNQAEMTDKEFEAWIARKLNKVGEVEPVEYIKACPCFDVRSEFSNFLRNVVVKP